MAAFAKPHLLSIVEALLAFQVLVAEPSSGSLQNQHQCSFSLISEGQLPASQPVAVYNASIPSACARLCRKHLGVLCNALGYHQGARECRVYSDPYARLEMVQAQGFDFYDGCQVKDSCDSLLTYGFVTSGAYDLDLKVGGQGVRVYCDMTTEGGGWTVFQRRQDGSVNFNRTWAEYQHGFGSLDGEFWLGNEILHQLTAVGRVELRVELKDWQNTSAFALYQDFRVGEASTNYALTASGYSGTAGDCLSMHNGYQFSTWDEDHDTDKTLNCAQKNGGGWWFFRCAACSTNNLFGGVGQSGNHYMYWFYWKNSFEALAFSEMKFRRAAGGAAQGESVLEYK